jgi:hypothetical protein
MPNPHREPGDRWFPRDLLDEIDAARCQPSGADSSCQRLDTSL